MNFYILEEKLFRPLLLDRCISGTVNSERKIVSKHSWHCYTHHSVSTHIPSPSVTVELKTDDKHLIQTVTLSA